MSQAAPTSNKLVTLMAKKQWFWLLLILLLLVLTFWWIPGDTTGTSDTYSVELEGKRIYYEAMSDLMQNVSRSADQLIPSDAGTIVILGPARIPSDDEWYDLYQFVSNGGTLLYAADPRTENFTASSFRMEFKNKSYVAEPEDGPPISPDPWEPGQNDLPQRMVRTFQNDTVAWRSETKIETSLDTYGVDVLVSDGTVQAVRRTIGAGTAVFVASDAIFQNRSMMDSDSAAFASVLLRCAYPKGPVYFDESLNTSGTPRVLGILFTPLFRPLTLQVLLFTVLFGWWGSRRFGPAKMGKSTDRRAIVEHAQALGSMQYRVGAASHALRAYFEYFRSSAQVPGGRIDKVAGVLAARSGIEVTLIEKLLNETQAAIQNPNLGQGAAAGLISKLAKLKDRMTRYGEKRT